MVYRGLIVLLFLVVSPIYVVIWVIIVLFSGTPVFFVQRRVGKGGRIFPMYKFRTMKKNAETMQWRLRARNESDGPTFKIKDDPRFTKTGKVLSRTGLDELPQLWNVLRGDMALIGPRPLPISEAKKLAPWMQQRHSIRPGIISPAILSDKYHKNFVNWMRSDVAYAKSKNVWGDTQLLFRLLPFGVKLLWRGIWG